MPLTVTVTTAGRGQTIRYARKEPTAPIAATRPPRGWSVPPAPLTARLLNPQKLARNTLIFLGSGARPTASPLANSTQRAIPPKTPSCVSARSEWQSSSCLILIYIEYVHIHIYIYIYMYNMYCIGTGYAFTSYKYESIHIIGNFYNNVNNTFWFSLVHRKR